MVGSDIAHVVPLTLVIAVKRNGNFNEIQQ